MSTAHFRRWFPVSEDPFPSALPLRSPSARVRSEGCARKVAPPGQRTPRRTANGCSRYMPDGCRGRSPSRPRNLQDQTHTLSNFPYSTEQSNLRTLLSESRLSGSLLKSGRARTVCGADWPSTSLRPQAQGERRRNDADCSCPAVSKPPQRFVYPIRDRSTALAASRPSRMAHTTRDCPRCMSPAVKTPATEVSYSPGFVSTLPRPFLAVPKASAT